MNGIEINAFFGEKYHPTYREYTNYRIFNVIPGSRFETLEFPINKPINLYLQILGKKSKNREMGKLYFWKKRDFFPGHEF